MIKKGSIILSFLIITAFILSACAPTTPTQTTSPATTATTTAAPKVIELKFATIMPPQASITQAFTAWGAKVEEATSGRVKITNYLGGSLLKTEELLSGTQSGISDVTWYTTTENPGEWDLHGFNELPLLGYKSSNQASKIYTQLLNDKSLGLAAEYEKNGVMPYATMYPPPFQIFTSKKPVHGPADVKGMKLYALGDMGDVISKAGGAPVTMEITEAYMSLERGLIEGVCTHAAAMMVFGLFDYTEYASKFGDGGCYNFMNSFIINPKTWNSLPADIQKIIKDLEPWQAEEMTKASNMEADIGWQILNDKKGTVINLTESEMKAWEDLAKPVQQAWVDKMTAKGKGNEAQAILDRIKKLIAETPE